MDDLSRIAISSIGSPLGSTVFGFTPAANKALTSDKSSNFAAFVKSLIWASVWAKVSEETPKRATKADILKILLNIN